jgi:hypothetical protein
MKGPLTPGSPGVSQTTGGAGGRTQCSTEPGHSGEPGILKLGWGASGAGATAAPPDWDAPTALPARSDPASRSAATAAAMRTLMARASGATHIVMPGRLHRTAAQMADLDSAPMRKPAV